MNKKTHVPIFVAFVKLPWGRKWMCCGAYCFLFDAKERCGREKLRNHKYETQIKRIVVRRPKVKP